LSTNLKRIPSETNVVGAELGARVVSALPPFYERVAWRTAVSAGKRERALHTGGCASYVV
jgi:hypothetical protein